MQIAIDGPAGAGKSTVAREVAAQLGFKYLDTGAMYRAIGVALADAGIDTADGAAVTDALPSVEMKVEFDGDSQKVCVNGQDMTGRIRSPEAAMQASSVAAFPGVRDKLVELQRRTAAGYDIIMDGRDIGSYVLPDADYKFYLTASPRARAERRRRDLLRLGQDVSEEEIEAEIRRRDAQDMHREYAPLRQAPDQVLIDTTAMSQQEAAAEILRIVRGQA
ncbi:MAG: (d)CMP kinase [Clostridia bacterium]|nr:(d)CMP kinase [Clostridia bacterium]